MFTHRQVQSGINISSVLNTTTDCLRFVTQFFDVINQSGCHIYHSALLLAPQSSVVRNLYSQQILSPVLKIINGIPISWDSCTASTGVVSYHATWSPCGKFIAVYCLEIKVMDSSTLQVLSVLKPSTGYNMSRKFLIFSPDGQLLASIYMEKERGRLVVFLIYVTVLTSVPGRRYSSHIMHVFDIKTGVIVTTIKPPIFSRPFFSGNTTIILPGKYGTLYTYDALSGTCLCKDNLGHKCDGYLGFHEGSLWVSTNFRNDRESKVNIQEVQLTTTPPSLIKSFTVPSYDGLFSFSPVSSHASFVTKTKITILNVKDSRVLLQAKAAHQTYTLPGLFSSNGCFFACATKEQEIHVWKNISAKYEPWGNLQSQLPFDGFSFSPLMSSILTWGYDGVQLLELSSHPIVPSPSKPKWYQGCVNYLVACSADGAYVATAQWGKSEITVMDTLLETPQQSFNTNMQILDIKIVGNTLFVADGHRLASWHLETGELVCEDETAAITASTPHPLLVLSNDCSQIGFIDKWTIYSYAEKIVSLYDVQAQRILYSYMVWLPVVGIRFSLDGYQLLVLNCCDNASLDVLKLERGDGDLANATNMYIGDKCHSGLWPWVDLFASHGWHIRQGVHGKPEQVVDSRGDTCLWLPLSWRVKQALHIRWDGKFLVFMGDSQAGPIIIEFQQ